MRRNFYKTLVVIVLALLLAAEACVSPVVAASVQTEDCGTEATVGEVENANGEETSVSEVSTDVPEHSFETQCTILNTWNTGYNAEITLINTGTETIHNWMLEFQTDDKITNLWNGIIHYQEEGIYRIKNAGWNQDIKSGGSIVFGYTAECKDEPREPKDYRILSFRKQAEENLYKIDSVITNAWETGYTMQISIENLSDAPIEHWALTFNFAKEIKNLWNAELDAHSNMSYSIHNALNNSNIKVGEKVWFEFEVATQDYEQCFPENVKLDMSGFEPDTKKEDTEEPDTEESEDKNTDYLDALYAYYGIDKNIEDNDKDGIPDTVEMLVLGLNPAMNDSDGNGILDGDEDYDEDGLSNLLELELGCDPAEPDSDYDGLTDGEEYNTYHTNPLDEDTDKDSLTDYEEVQIGTDPLRAATDGTVSDAEKCITQTLPQENIDLDSTEEGMLMPSLTVDMAGYIGSHVSISKAEMDVFLSNRAIMGAPVTIINDNEANSQNMTLSFDISSIEDMYGTNEIKNINICKLEGYVPESEEAEDENESRSEKKGENYTYVPLDTNISWKDSTISAAIDGSGVYMVINELEFLNSVGLDFLSPGESKPELTMGQADVVFVVDTTASMSGIIYKVATNMIHFAEVLEKDYNMQANFALIEFKDTTVHGDDSTYVHQNGMSNWFSDAGRFAQEVRWLSVSGGGDNPESLVDALGMAATLDYRENVDKFVIAITDDDYKIENQYGYESLEEVVQTLNDAGIITSVVAPKKFEETYSCITDEGGIFCNIERDFSDELEKLTALMGTASGDGIWYLLDTYDYVKLDKSYEELGNLDSDGDGLTDAEELGTMVNMDFSAFAKNLLIHYGQSLSGSQQQNIANAIDNGYFFKNMYMTISNPKVEDADMDGIIDSKDPNPKTSVQFAVLYHKNFNFHSGTTDFRPKENATTGYRISYNLNFADFFENNKKYNTRLCKASSIFAGLAYNKDSGESSTAADDYYYLCDSKKGTEQKLSDIMKRHGFYHVETYNVGSDTHKAKCYVGIKDVVLGKKEQQVIAVIIKGTNGTAAQWSSNFNIGMGLENGIDYNNDWGDISNHKGFSTAANRVYKKVMDYVKKYRKKEMPLVYWVTGHSRGGAIANLLSAKLVDNNNKVFAYTFATPNTTTNTTTNLSRYGCIFNTINARDFVPTLPCTDWGFGRYGKTANITMSSSMKKTWKSRMEANAKNKPINGSYNEMSEKSLDGLVDALADITEDRKSIYDYDGTNRTVTIGRGVVYNGKNIIRSAFLPDTMKKELFAVKGYKITSSSLTEVKVKQSPMFFMQLVAATMAGKNEPDSNKIDALSFAGYNVAKKYESAKQKLISANVFKGISHAHYVDTYILITDKTKAADYK